MVRVDVSVLDFYQVFYHRIRWQQLLIKQAVHYFNDFLSQILKPHKLWHLNLSHNPSQLLVDKLNALQGRRFKSQNLLLRQNLESNFRHKEVRTK